jgi:hypothetical protein
MEGGRMIKRHLPEIEVTRQMRRDTLIYRLSVAALSAVLAASFVMIFIV